jgi:methionyl-tRNA formyltransferase
MKIAFFGTPDFAVPTLLELQNDQEIEVKLVITQPDRKVGRKLKITPPPVKQSAIELGIPVAQPTNSSELREALSTLEVDFFVVVAYGMILSEEILKIPKIAPINIHASLLPKYRGASPIQQALLNGDKESGVAIMKMEKKMDTGPIYAMQRVEISDNEGLEQLHDRLSILGAKLICSTLKDIEEEALIAIEQNSTGASYCKKISKNDGLIDWNKDTKEILNMIRAYTPWPSTQTEVNGVMLKILAAEDGETKINPGEIVLEASSLKIGTGSGSISIKNLQSPGKKPSDISSFINGNKKLFTDN